MTAINLLEAAKLRIRKSSVDLLDNDIQQHIDFAISDLERIGVDKSYLDNPDAILTEAILTYTKANYGQSVDERLMEAYNSILVKIKGAQKYNQPNTEFCSR